MRIASKISLLFGASIVVLFVAYAFYEISDDARALRADARSELTAIARESSATLSLLDPAVAEGTLRPFDDTQTTVAIRFVPARLAPNTETFEESDQRIAVHRAFTVPGGRVAEIEVSRTTDNIDRFIRYETVRAIALVTGVIVLGTLFSMLVGSRIIARPMRGLIAKFRRVGGGDFSPIETKSAGNEFDLLTNELAEMTQRLASSRDALVHEHGARIETMGQLQHAERLTTVGKLASGVAHELGTPLNVISGYARLIASGQEKGESAADAARIIDEQTQRITRIVRQLLDFARRGEPHLAIVDLRTTVTRAVELASVLAKKTGVRVEIVEAAEPMLAKIDDNRMQQVVVNLVHNAIQASTAGTPVTLQIERTKAHRPGGTNDERVLRLDVIDRGTGIAEADIHRVFEPFFTTKAVGVGTGLGLSVSHGIVEEHGGWIGVTSEVGAGSRFSVFLPEVA